MTARFKLAAPESIRPRRGPSLDDATGEFFASHEEVRALLHRYADIDLAGTHFPNPFVRGIRLSLATGLHVIAAHERRHVWQAWRVRHAAERAVAAWATTHRIALMPRVPAREFERLPLRAHRVLAGVPLHDVWAIDLPRMRPGITLDEFLRAAGGRPFKPSAAVRALLGIRFFAGRLLGWDRPVDRHAQQTFATGLTTTDLSQTLVTASISPFTCAASAA